MNTAALYCLHKESYSMDVHQAVFIKSAVKPKDFPPAELPEVAFVGRSNVGKSSLINVLAHQFDPRPNAAD